MMNNKQPPKDLLPWYVNGTLSGNELEKVKQHVEKCDVCQQEIKFLQAIRTVARQPLAKPATDFALQRIMRDLKPDPDKAKRNRSWWQPAFAIAALLVIMVQGIVILNLYNQPDTFVPANGENAVKIQFANQSTAKAIQQVLSSVNAVIVEGPSAAGLYSIRFTDTPDEKAIQQRTQSLQQNRDIVEYIQSD